MLLYIIILYQSFIISNTKKGENSAKQDLGAQNAIIKPMIDSLIETLRKKCEIPTEEKILVGVSGGADSMALLYALIEAGFPVVVGHLDHGIRAGSESDVKFVCTEAEKLGVVFVTERVDTEAYAREGGLSLEEAARELRYRFLFRTAVDKECKAVAVGHHADDQAETILLHLVRGSGLKGLVGMPHRRLTQWHPEIPLVRPLLELPHADLVNFCERQDISVIEDESNQDNRFLRNRIRHDLLPLLDEMNPRFSKTLSRLGKIVRGDVLLLESLTDQIWSEVGGEVIGESAHFSRARFLDVDLGMQRRLMRKAFDFLRPGLLDVGFDLIERAVEAVEKPPESGETDLAQGVRLVICKEKVSLIPWKESEDLSGYPQMVEELQIDVGKRGRYAIGGTWEIVVDPIESIELAEIETNQDRYIAFLDLGISPTLLKVRKRKEGDRISPLGMDGRGMKLSDLMINEGVPSSAREGWPVIENRGDIVWVPGCRTAESTRVGPGAGLVIRLSVERKT